jgi:hypothetical protein
LSLGLKTAELTRCSKAPVYGALGMNPARTLLDIVIWGIKLAPVPALLFATWVFMVEVLANTPIQRAMVWGFAALASCFWAIYGALYLIEKFFDWTQEAKEGKRVARLLEAAQAAGHRRMAIFALVNLWSETQPENASIRFVQNNYRLRVLKDAVTQNLLQADLGNDSFAHAKTKCEIKSAIEFFKERRWNRVTPRQPGEVYADEGH